MESNKTQRPLAVVTGASSGIGYHLALEAAEHGYDLVLAADQPMDDIVSEAQGRGASVQVVMTELANTDGVDKLRDALDGRAVDVLCANAGHGLSGAFLDQDFDDVLHVIDTNITGTIYLIQTVGGEMVRKGSGRILVTGSIAGLMPGAFQAVYHGSKAFIDSFTAAFRNETKDSGVSVTCLMPGATDTEFFDRAGMQDTKVGADDDAKMAAGDVAKIGWKAMMKGEADVVAGFKNKLQAASTNVLSDETLAEMNRKQNQPGSAEKV